MSNLWRHTFVVYVEDKPGVLNRVASLCRRRAFNIESLTVGHAETPSTSRMTIVVRTDRAGARRLEANLYKLVNVVRVHDITEEPAIFRELAMVKVATTAETRIHVMQLVDVFQGARCRRGTRFGRHRNDWRRGENREAPRGSAAVRDPRAGANWACWDAPWVP